MVRNLGGREHSTEQAIAKLHCVSVCTVLLSVSTFARYTSYRKPLVWAVTQQSPPVHRTKTPYFCPVPCHDFLPYTPPDRIIPLAWSCRGQTNPHGFGRG